MFYQLQFLLIITAQITYTRAGRLINNFENVKQEDHFDFIVVGSGSAGGIVINRLSAQYNVLVLEAGSTPSETSNIPLLRYEILSDPNMMYYYDTVPQENVGSKELNNTLFVWRGKSLGGSSSVNAMMYVRGNPRDYDRWATLVNDTAWTAENVLKYYKLQEDYHGSFETEPYHGIGGDIYIGNLSYNPPLVDHVQAWFEEMGFNVGDINSWEERDGDNNIFGTPDVGIKRGQRYGTYQSVIQPVLERENLVVFDKSIATKILLDSNKKAYGVEYIRGGEKFTALADKEVIVCAGAIESPKLLLLSGIGESDELLELNITPEIHLPSVGRNLQDHPQVTVFVTLNDSVSFQAERDLRWEHWEEYSENRTGPLSSNVRLGVGFASSPGFLEPEWPDLFYVFQAGTSLSYNGGKDILMGNVNLVRPNSIPAGTIKLASNDPSVHPLIDPRPLQDPSDIERLIDGAIYLTDSITKSETFQKLGAYFDPFPVPACDHLQPESRDYWECVIREMYESTFYLVGGCRMGKAGDTENSVVDPNFRVQSAQGLRVIDSSTMPIIATGEPHAVSMMLGEVGAARILDSWK